MKEITLGMYRRYLRQDHDLVVEVVRRENDHPAGPWQPDARLTALHKYQRKVGRVWFRVGQNEPMAADLYQVRFDELPESEWYEFFTAGMSDIHPNDRIAS